ncbi:MAG: chorismate-binding protein [Chlamydiota bacterium]|nr:chorismate-binding protein [Chlamydiota bacterium]
MSWVNDFILSGSICSLNSGEVILGWGQRELLEAPSTNGISLYFPDFFLQTKTPWIKYEYYKKIRLSDLASALDQLKISKEQGIKWEEADKPQFSQTFQELKDHFFLNDLLSKAVPYTFQKSLSRISRGRFINSLKALVTHSMDANTFLYGSWNSNEGVLGGTPELLFKQDSETPRLIKTVACAGTCPSSANFYDFLADKKESREHNIVIECINNELKPFGDVQVGDVTVKKLATLSHMYTPITLKADQKLSFVQLVNALHPTPALGAYPKKQGQKWLKAQEQKCSRNRFGAPVGYLDIDNNEFACYVAIRNMQWDQYGLSLGAGCGVVSESHLEKEWDEIQLKLKAIKKMLAL